GLLITDCLEMEAIAGTVGTATAAVEALKAGADIALICHTLSTQRAAFAAIRDAVQSGDLPESRLNESVDRVLAAKRRFHASAPPDQGSPWLDPAHKALEREIARASITVVQKGGGIPLRAKSGDSIWFLSAHPATQVV